MDPSINSAMNGSQHGENHFNPNNNSFLDEITDFTDPGHLHTNDELSQFFDPALFEASALGPGFSQQAQPLSQNNFNQNQPRQSNSPGLSQFNSPQPSYQHPQFPQHTQHSQHPQHPQHPQPMFNSQPMPQSSYDPRFFVRPSQSPVNYDGFAYHPQIGYQPQQYQQHQQQQMNMPPRPSPSPATNLQQRPPPQHQHPTSAVSYTNIAQRQPTIPAGQQTPDVIQFNPYDQGHPTNGPFVDPNMLSANHMGNSGGTLPNYQPQQTYLQPEFFNTSSLDPRFLDGAPAPHPGFTDPPTNIITTQGAPVGPPANQTGKPIPPVSKPKATKSISKKTKPESLSETDSSDDELAIEEDEPEMIPAVLAVAQPTDERGKLLYNAVNAVWSPRNRSASVEKVRSAIAAFGDTVRGLRDSWKSKNDSLRKAELPNSPTASDVTLLKEEVAKYRSIMELLMTRSLLHGHPTIVKRYAYPVFPALSATCYKSCSGEFRLMCKYWSPRLLTGPGPDCTNLDSFNNVICKLFLHSGMRILAISIATSCLDSVQDITWRDFPPRVMLGRKLDICFDINANANKLIRLGENQFTMSALYSFMLDRVNAGDYDSSLVSNILKFVVKFETLDTEMLEMTKVSKILQRFTKKATNESKTLAQTILNNAVAASAKKNVDAKGDKAASPQTVDSPGALLRKEIVTGMKRPREGDAAPPTAAKKAAKTSSKPLALQNAERRKALEAAQGAKGGDKTSLGNSAAAGSATPGATASKGKVAVLPPPKSAVFGSLLSASKKPGTSLAARAAAAKDKPSPGTTTAANSVKDPSKRDSPPRNGAVSAAKTSSSFLDLLTDMEKKPEKAEKKELEIPNETEEERTRRLRKEARRRLRVTWKADAELVEIRHFTHDPEEEVGHNDSQVRDVGDIGGEGEMLKLHQGVAEEEEDEDEDSFEELEPYTPPSEVDFNILAEDGSGLSLFAENFARFGGPTKAESASSESQSKHEQDTLMAIYVSKSDRPPTPKEPDDDDGEFEPAEPEVPFGEPKEEVRRREREYVERQARLKPQTGNTSPGPQKSSSAIPTDLQQFLGNLRNQQSQPVQVAPVAPSTNYQTLLSSVEQIKLQLQGQNSTSPYQQPAPAAIPTNIDLGAILASLQQQSQQSQPHAQTSSITSQLSGLPLGLGANPNPYPGATEDQSRKHGRGDGHDHDDYGRKGGSKKKKPMSGSSEAKPYNYKTQKCSFWEQGKCLKGDKCTYLHGDE
ncbi:hypothetical protein, variant 1 [Exophiala mesophila]|uniref:C3H1-type domain-containing protein n=1 Tax=Exophiala mesophila TaxID=212818 RepID=A0A0D1ZRH5_EXOME|nr:hypothetical protein, variant 1 [Exophiala mesophila]KIV96519.1 hypothetical protein, variant 1 [Exophiala mesophila]